MKTKHFLIASLISTGLIFAACPNDNGLYAQNSMAQSKVIAEQYDQVNGDVVMSSDDNDQIKMTNFPDPFIDVTYIQYTLPFPASVRLYVYESNTGKSTLLFEGHQVMGTHYVAFTPEGNVAGEYVAELVTLQSSVIEVMYRDTKDSIIK